MQQRSKHEHDRRRENLLSPGPRRFDAIHFLPIASKPVLLRAPLFCLVESPTEIRRASPSARYNRTVASNCRWNHVKQREGLELSDRLAATTEGSIDNAGGGVFAPRLAAAPFVMGGLMVLSGLHG